MTDFFLPCSSNKGKTIILILISIIQVLSIFYYAYYFVDNGYLPSPFVFDKSDSFMDFFHTMWWADNDGRYTEWISVYPPLNFIFLNIIKWAFLDGISFSDAFMLRDAGYSITVFFIFLYLITPIIVLSTSLWKNFSLIEKVLIYLGIVLSAPMLFALERGNLVIFTLIFLSLALSNSGMSRSASIAILINIKPYFALLLIHYAIKRRWNDLLICILMSGGLYLITGLILDANFLLFLQNTLSFSQNETIFSLRAVAAMPSSVSAFSYILASDDFRNSVESRIFSYPIAVAVSIEMIKWFVLSLVLSALVYAHKKLSDRQIITVLVIVTTNLGVWVGGYSLISYVALIPVLLNMRYRLIYFGILLLIFTPIDMITLLHQPIGQQYSYLSGSYVEIDWTLGIGSIVRPALNLVLLCILFYEILFKTGEKSTDTLVTPVFDPLKLGVDK